jgi:hypothetical protein
MKSKLLLLVVPFLCFSLAGAQMVAKMDLGLTVEGVIDADTIRIDELSTFDFYYENDDTLGGYSTGFTIWSDNGVEWAYDTAILRIDWVSGFPPDPMIFDTTWAIVTMVDDSRQDPVGTVWDQTFDISLADTTRVDGVDTIMWGGTRKDYGLYPGPLERQALIHFHATAGLGGTLCIDSAKVGLAGDFIFVDIAGGTLTPVVLWPEGGRCWPVAGATAADDGTPGVPFTYGLGQNYPNPFNPVTMICYSLARKGQVKLVIYNVLGQNVRTLVDGEQEANNYEVVWNGDDNNGAAVASGIYFYKLIADEYVETKKMLLMR